MRCTLLSPFSRHCYLLLWGPRCPMIYAQIFKTRAFFTRALRPVFFPKQSLLLGVLAWFLRIGSSRLAFGSGAVASRCLPLLLPPAGSSRLAFGSVVVASRCLPLLLPPAGPCRLAFGSTAVASLCLPLPPFASRCFCLKIFGAARAYFFQLFIAV